LFARKEEKRPGGERAQSAPIADIAGIGNTKRVNHKGHEGTQRKGGTQIPPPRAAVPHEHLLIAKIGEPKAHHGGAETRRTTKIEDRNNQKLSAEKGHEGSKLGT
jgi:hypothetical protein